MLKFFREIRKFLGKRRLRIRWKKSKLPEDWELIKRNLPINHEGWKSLGNSLYSEQKYDEAIAAYYKSIELNPHNADTYVNLGTVLLNSNDFNTAIECYQKSIELQNAADAKLSRAQPIDGRFPLQSNEPDESSQIKAVAYYNLGVAYHTQGNLDAAISSCKNAIKLNAKDAEAFSRLGTLFYEKADYKEALDPYLQALELSPDNALIIRQIGWIYLLLDNLTKASYYLNKAWELSKETDSYSVMNIGHVELLKNQLISAQKWYRKSLSLTVDKADFYNMMQSDYVDLQLITKGIDKAWYDDMMQKL